MFDYLTLAWKTRTYRDVVLLEIPFFKIENSSRPQAGSDLLRVPWFICLKIALTVNELAETQNKIKVNNILINVGSASFESSSIWLAGVSAFLIIKFLYKDYLTISGSNFPRGRGTVDK